MISTAKERAAAAKFTRHQVEEVLAMASSTLRHRAEHQAKLDRITQEMDARINVIRQEYAQDIINLSELVSLSDNALQSCKERLQVWAEAHRETEFDGDKKSIRFLTAVIGFRKLKPAVETLTGWTGPKAALALLRKKWGKDYVKTTYGLLKNELIRDRDKLGSKLATCGLVIEEAEEFYIDHKTEQRDQAPEVA